MSKSFKTFLKHTAKDFHNQSVNPPVVRASTIIFKSMKDIRKTQAKAKKNKIDQEIITRIWQIFIQEAIKLEYSKIKKTK